MLKQFEDKWLGNKKIKIAIESGETSGGTPLVLITYDDGTNEEYSQKMLESEGVVTATPQDLTEFRDKRVVGPTRECLAILRDYNLREKELNYLMQKLEASIIENIRRATRILWGVENDGEETLVAVDRVILSQKTTLKDVLGDGLDK